MPTNTTLVDYAPWLEFAEGYVEALLAYFSSRDDAADWIGVDEEDLSPELLSAAMKDCRQFLEALARLDTDAERAVKAVLGDNLFGQYLFRERMEVGVGFRDLVDVEAELRAKLIDAAGDLKPFDVEIGEDRLVRIVSSPLTYSRLSQLQKGFADALVEFESQSQSQEDLDCQDAEDEDEVSGEWDGVTVHDFSSQSLRTIVEDCERFVADIVGDERAKWDDLFAEISEHDIGWHLYLERQGAGVGLRDLLPKGNLLDRVLKSADDLGELSVEVGDDGQIHIHRQRGWAATPTT